MLKPKEPPSARRRGFLEFWSDLLFWVFQKTVWLGLLLYFRLRVRGKIPPSGAILIASNHTSFLDWVWLGAVCPRRIRFLMSDLYGKIFGLRWFFRWNKVILVPEEGGLREFMAGSLKALEEDAALGIFPEGWITQDGSLREFQPGVIHLAMRTGAMIVPVAIVGGFQAFPRTARFPRPKKVEVRIGEALKVEDLFPSQGTRSDKMKAAASALRDKILHLQQ